MQMMMARFDGVVGAVQNIGMRVDAIERRDSLPALDGAGREGRERPVKRRRNPTAQEARGL